MLTLSIDTCSHTSAQYGRLAQLFSCGQEKGIEVIIDLSIGSPYEEDDEARRMFDFLDEQPVVSVGVNSYFRVYPGTPLYQQLMLDNKLTQFIIPRKPDMDLLYPTFFCRFTEEKVRQFIGGREIFRIEGLEKATNYQRVSPCRQGK
jgi:radical SAM superfamily enzyme YgiQ (UPF0313 family)